jgi:hypothetical protein
MSTKVKNDVVVFFGTFSECSKRIKLNTSIFVAGRSTKNHNFCEL